MAKERIVLETTDQRKAALIETVALQGETLAGWIEEQISLNFPAASRTNLVDVPSPNEPSALADPAKALESLAAQDWSFTDDDTRYLTHDLHPYPAKFIPQIPAHLIARLSVPGDVVLDPFGGSATTAVEAVRMRRRAVSIDANPLSAIIGRVKTGLMTPEIEKELDQLFAAAASYLVGVEGRSMSWSEGLLARYASFVPDIPNLEKWFTGTVIAELALLRHLIRETTEGLAQDAALLALSRIIIRVSNQESETRYVSEPKAIGIGLTIRAFLEALRTVRRRLEAATDEFAYADARFLIGDSRTDLPELIGENTVDLIVTSPPYPNATDYHLYHRFRLFWLGFDPRALGRIEIGSHLRHQRNGSGFDEYQSDMHAAFEGCMRVLQPGRYAVFVVGDAVFKGKTFSTSSALNEIAREVGFETVGIISRPIHETRRSFSKPARRARSEQLIVLRKPNRAIRVQLAPPRYRMWAYEELLRSMEIEALLGKRCTPKEAAGIVTAELAQPEVWNIRRLTFTNEALGERSQPTWQSTLENGDGEAGRRKDPKYVTHGLHPFKGKFYPQLAKALLNISGTPLGGSVLDPFCGSGTVPLEGMLNGFRTFGCDFNPLAAKIAKAKTGILSIDRSVVEHSIRSLLDRVRAPIRAATTGLDQFAPATHAEIERWFPTPVIGKLNWLLGQIRLFGEPILVDFFEVILSSIIREISQQDPTDLRIRRRKEPLEDAPVFQLFSARLAQQYERLVKYWRVAGRQPGPIFPPQIINGDSRSLDDLKKLELQEASIDCVVTSPPYATALPYIDTDRLSLLAIMGISSNVRAGLEENLTGSREIRKSRKQELEAALLDDSAFDLLPKPVVKAIREIYEANLNSSVGFRRDNMPALLWRYFIDMRANLQNMETLLKPGGMAYYVAGDSRTNAGGTWVKINTCQHLCQIAESVGLTVLSSIGIDVTKENYKHIKNAITENQILVFQKPF